MPILSMGDMLKRLGWNDGFHIPIANAENKALEEQVMKLTLRRAKVATELEFAKSRYEALEKHIKFLRQESEQNQMLLNEYKKQIDSEMHQIRVNKGEKDKLNQETLQLARQVADIHERQGLKKADLTRAFAKMERAKTEATWDTEALAGWEEALRKRDQDNDLLKKFTTEDSRRIQELEARRQVVALDVANHKKIIEKMVAECANYENVLNRSGKICKQQQMERASLIKRWQDCIRVMRQRDQDIELMENQIEIAREILIKQKELVEEQSAFLENECNNNRNMDEEIIHLNHTNSRLMRELNQLIDYIVLLENDLATVRRLVSSTGQELQKQRIRSRQLDQESEHRVQQIEELEKEVLDLKQKSEEVKSSSMSAAERTNRLEQLIEQHKQLGTHLVADIGRAGGDVYRSQQKLCEFKNAYKVLESENHSYLQAITQMRKRATMERLDKEKQEGSVYELKFRLEILQSKLEKVTADDIQDKESYEAILVRLNELEAKLASKNEIRADLQFQVNRITDEMRRLTLAITDDSDRLKNLQTKLLNNKLTFEACLKTVQAAKQRTQQCQVNENVFLLHVAQLDKCISKEKNKIHSLQQLNVDLQKAMLSRKFEIEANCDSLTAQRNILMEDNNRLRLDLSTRRVKLEHFISKHHLALMSLGKDEDGKPLSITYFKVRNAQERFALEQKGDELDTRITRTEKEILAMENTLKVVNMTNVKFKTSLSTIERDGPEAEKMSVIEKETSKKLLQMKHNNKILIQKQEEIYDLQDKINSLRERREELKEILSDLKEESEKYEREEKERAEKIHRTNKQIKSLKSKISVQKKLKYDQDLQIRHLQESNKTGLAQLLTVATTQPEVAPLIDRYVGGEGLSLPRPRAQLAHGDSSATSDSILSMTDKCGTTSSSSTPSVRESLSRSTSNSIHKTSQIVSKPSEPRTVSIATNNLMLQFDESSSIRSAAGGDRIGQLTGSEVTEKEFVRKSSMARPSQDNGNRRRSSGQSKRAHIRE